MRRTKAGILMGILCFAVLGLAASAPSAAAPAAHHGEAPALPAPDPACQQTAAKAPFCADPSSGANPAQLCSYLPPDSVPGTGYTAFSCTGQVQFDTYSWETLVALNWPADHTGKPCTKPGPECPYTSITNAPNGTPRVWDYYLSANQVIPTPTEFRVGSFPGAPACGARAAAKGAPPVRVLTMTSKADGSVVPDIIQPSTTEPLIDRNLNYTMYEIVLNQDEATYILTNHLNTVAGQEAARTIDFPCGLLPGQKGPPACAGAPGSIGAIEIKAAWRLLDPAKDDLNSYFWREQDIYISAERSADHRPFCIAKAKLGLVGLHILHKTASQADWFWSTFEHRDNAPPTTSASSCVGPAGPGLPRYSYYQAQCPPSACVPNQGPKGPADGNFLWSRQPPYAQLYATRTAAGNFGTQVVRCQPVAQNSPSSPLLDARFYSKLANTVWRNYTLTGTQWAFGYTGAPPFPPAQARCLSGSGFLCAPPYLLDSVLETYMQPKVDLTNDSTFSNGCVQCHNLATTVGKNQKPADFSFLLGRVAGSSVAVPAAHP
jgi:hypothetical protein